MDQDIEWKDQAFDEPGWIVLQASQRSGTAARHGSHAAATVMTLQEIGGVQLHGSSRSMTRARDVSHDAANCCRLICSDRRTAASADTPPDESLPCQALSANVLSSDRLMRTWSRQVFG